MFVVVAKSVIVGLLTWTNLSDVACRTERIGKSLSLIVALAKENQLQCLGHPPQVIYSFIVASIVSTYCLRIGCCRALDLFTTPSKMSNT